MMGVVHGWICGPKVYEFEGWFFEYGHHICWPLRKDGEPRKRAGDKFYDMIDRFFAQSQKEQDACRVGGGCVSIYGKTKKE